MTTSIQHTPFTSPDLAQERLAALKAHLPEIFTADGKIDLQALASVDGIEPLREHYRFEWTGKTAARRMAYSPASSTLTFLEDKSVGVEHAKGNAIIEGENLEVLKLLLASYRARVKCIYIDPPYNTGNDFVYDDDYREGRTPYWQQTGQVEDGVRIDSNTESDGRYHSNWLNMIYPRLIVARELLQDDGVIFVSIDDNEVHNLRKVMDEVFGEENFVAQLIWHNSSRHSPTVATEHEYVMLYSKNELDKSASWTQPRKEVTDLNAEIQKLLTNKTELEVAEKEICKQIESLASQAEKSGDSSLKWIRNYKNLDSHWRLFYPVDLTGEGAGPARYFGDKLIDAPAGRHWMGQEYIDELIAEERIVWRADRAYRKLYIEESAESLKSVFRIPTRNGSEVIKQILGKDVFDKPKPHNFIQHILSFVLKPNDLILDFFGGSGSTAQAVLELNKADGGNRKFILVQLPELTDAKSEAFKAGYKKISDITMERVKRVINGYGKKPDTITGHAGCGFAAYRLSRSHFPRQDWAPDPKAGQEANAAAFEAWVAKYESSLYMQAAPSDVLDEVLLKCGFDLARRIEAEANAPQTVWQVWRSGDTGSGDRLPPSPSGSPPFGEHKTPPRALLCLETPVSSATVDYLVSRADACKADGTRLIVLAAALDATAKWNLRHAFEKLLTVF